MCCRRLYNDLNEESFEADLEETIMKIKWSMMGDEKEENRRRRESLSGVAFNVVVDELQGVQQNSTHFCFLNFSAS